MAAYTYVACSNCGNQNYICLKKESYVEMPVSFKITCNHCKSEQVKRNQQLAFDIDTPETSQIVFAEILD